MNLSNRSFSKYGNNPYSSFTYGNITLRAWIESLSTIIGDVNQNFELEIGDVVLLIYNQQNIDGQCTLCDINSDAKVNVLDVIDLVYIILNQE